NKIPYKIIGSIAFYERQEIKDIISFLRILVNPEDTISLKRVINTPPRGVGDTTILYLETLAKENSISLWKQLTDIDSTELSLRAKNAIWKFLTLYDLLKRYKDTMYPSEFIRFLIEKIGYIKMIEENNRFENKIEKIQNLEELISVAKNYESEFGINSIEEFLNRISLLTRVETEIQNKVDTTAVYNVSLMTLHAVKGLEFDVVFLTGLEEGVLPIYYTLEDKNRFWYQNNRQLFRVDDIWHEDDCRFAYYTLEEERRLCYVGITRAKLRLYLTHAFKRNIWGIQQEMCPSRFLEEILEVYKPELVHSINIPDINNAEKIDKINYLKIGEFVIHDKFGLGKVVDILPELENDKVVILFQDGQRRKFNLQYANLRKFKMNHRDEKNN
ncbi:MAG: hypothetical protein NZ839_03130, partial [Endomicrobia bacterium]|nr:hypothetical protein [Endomicrobiia bacterium]